MGIDKGFCLDGDRYIHYCRHAQPNTTLLSAAARTTTSITTRSVARPIKSSQTVIYATACSAHHKTTATFIPVTSLEIDRSDSEDAIPRKDVSLTIGTGLEKDTVLFSKQP